MKGGSDNRYAMIGNQQRWWHRFHIYTNRNISCTKQREKVYTVQQADEQSNHGINDGQVDTGVVQ